MSFCIDCGEPNDATAVFCIACGKKLYHEPADKPAERQANSLRFRLLILALVLVIAGGLILIFSTGKRTIAHRQGPNETPPGPAQISSAPVLTIIGQNRSGAAVSQGSGFVLSSDGLAGSNYHVFKGIVRATAECCNRRVFDVGSIEGADLRRDLVVFQLYERGTKAKPSHLPTVTLASSQELTVGQKVIAIGSPQGFQNTVSDGILSAIRESSGVRYLQITAPVSAGSSGGPVLDANGQMIGVATLQFEEGQNLNFAVAVQHLHPLLDQHLQLSLPNFQSLIRQAQHKQQTAASEASDTPRAPALQPVPIMPLTGQFGGVVHNQTADASAEFGIVVQDTDGLLEGCMLVRQPLFGSGPLRGFCQGR